LRHKRGGKANSTYIDSLPARSRKPVKLDSNKNKIKKDIIKPNCFGNPGLQATALIKAPKTVPIPTPLKTESFIAAQITLACWQKHNKLFNYIY